MKPEDYTQTRKCVILIVGFLETLLFSGVLFGWADLVFLMKLEGVFSSHCPNESLDEGNGTKVCQEQDNLFDLAFSLVTFSKGSTSILVALLLDHFGLQISRLLANLQVTTGWFLIAYSSKSNPYFLFPGALLLGLGGSHVRMNNFLIANLFPNHKSTIISLYNGAFCASAAVFLLFKYIYPFGFDLKISCVLLAGLSGVMVIPTAFLLPVKTIETSDSDNPDLFEKSINIAPKSSSKSQVEPIKPHFNSFDNNASSSINTAGIYKEYGSLAKPSSKAAKVDTSCIPESFLSMDYLIHLVWVCVLGLAMAVYAGTFEHWVETNANDEVVVSDLVEWFGFCHIPMLLVAPLGGLWLDSCLNEAKEEIDPIMRERRARMAVFWFLFVTTTIQLLQMICIFFNTVLIVHTSLFLFIFSRPMVNAIGVVYLRISFPSEQFNCLLGILGTMASVFSLVQFPLFVWSGSSPFAANLLVVVMISLVFSNPLNLLLKRKR